MLDITSGVDVDGVDQKHMREKFVLGVLCATLPIKFT